MNPGAIGRLATPLALVLIGCGAPAQAAVARLDLSCSGNLPGPGSDPGAVVAFTASVPFADGGLVALTDTGSGKALRLLYDAETTVGDFRPAGGSASPVVWTLATSLKAAFTGFVVTSEGAVTALRIGKANADGTRPFTAFDTRKDALARGKCTAS